MKGSLVEFLGCAFAVVITGVLVLLIISEFIDYKTPNDYAYVDLDGNAGAADYCSSSRAGMWCKAGDRKITVKEYSCRKEEE